MSKEIIIKVQETEELIDGMKKKIQEDQQKLQDNQKKNIEKYIEKLQKNIEEFKTEQERKNTEHLRVLSEALNEEVEAFRHQADLNYQAQKDMLIQLGIEEVLSQYGNFSHETTSDTFKTRE